MTKKTTLSTADIADRHRRYMALAMLTAGLMFLGKVGLYFAPESIKSYMDTFQIGMGIITVAFIVPIMVWKLSHRSSGERFVYFSEDGFAAQALVYAQKRSWAITFVLLAFLEGMAEGLTQYPSEIFLQIGLFVMLVTMSLLFLYKTRKNDGLAFEGGEATHA